MELLPVNRSTEGAGTAFREIGSGAEGGDWQAEASKKSKRTAGAFISTKKEVLYKDYQTNSLYSMNTAMAKTNQAKPDFNWPPSMRLLSATPKNIPAPESKTNSPRKG